MSSTDAALLAEPVTFFHSGLTAPNRIVKAAMTELICEWPEDEADADGRGKPTPAYQKLYEVWGQSGFGVLIFGNFAVDREYPEAKGNAILDRTATWDHIAAFKPVVEAAKKDGAIVLGQISHAGRQTQNTIAPIPLSSSDVKSPPLGPKEFNTPRPMTVDEIKDVVERFAYAAKVLYDAGAHGVQLHGAHGYLISQFLSQNVNLRTDDYGGSLPNRSRIIFEILTAIRAAVGDDKFLLSIKINSADFTTGGFSDENCRELAGMLEEAGVDLIELSGGTYESLAKSGGFVHLSESTVSREAYFIEFASHLRPHLRRTKLVLTGGFRTVALMAQAVREGSCDLVGLARPLTAEPELARLVLERGQAGARANLVPGVLQTASSGVQIVEMGAGKEVSDLSKQDVADSVVADIMGMANAIITK